MTVATPASVRAFHTHLRDRGFGIPPVPAELVVRLELPDGWPSWRPYTHLCGCRPPVVGTHGTFTPSGGAAVGGVAVGAWVIEYTVELTCRMWKVEGWLQVWAMVGDCRHCRRVYWWARG